MGSYSSLRSVIRPGLPCGRGGGIVFLHGHPPQLNSVGSGVDWVQGLFFLCIWRTVLLLNPPQSPHLPPVLMANQAQKKETGTEQGSELSLHGGKQGRISDSGHPMGLTGETASNGNAVNRHVYTVNTPTVYPSHVNNNKKASPKHQRGIDWLILLFCRVEGTQKSNAYLTWTLM